MDMDMDRISSTSAVMIMVTVMDMITVTIMATVTLLRRRKIRKSKRSKFPHLKDWGV